MVIGLGCPGIRWPEINMGAVGIISAFKSDCHLFDAILLLPVADHHSLFSKHHVADAFGVVAHTLVAVEPFDFLKMLVLLVEIIAPDAETDCDKQ